MSKSFGGATTHRTTLPLVLLTPAASNAATQTAPERTVTDVAVTASMYAYSRCRHRPTPTVRAYAEAAFKH